MKCYFCTLGESEGVKVRQEEVFDAETSIKATVPVCEYCLEKFLKPQEPTGETPNA